MLWQDWASEHSRQDVLFPTKKNARLQGKDATDCLQDLTKTSTNIYRDAHGCNVLFFSFVSFVCRPMAARASVQLDNVRVWVEARKVEAARASLRQLKAQKGKAWKQSVGKWKKTEGCSVAQ